MPGIIILNGLHCFSELGPLYHPPQRPPCLLPAASNQVAQATPQRLLQPAYLYHQDQEYGCTGGKQAAGATQIDHLQ